MEKEYYYIRDGSSVDYINPPVISRISTEDIKHLALYLIENFEPVPAVTVAEGYISALTSYSMENREYPYCDVFEKVKYGMPSTFLFTNVTLVLCEKDFRENGINEKNMNHYNKWREEYKKQLHYSQETYGKLYNKVKAK